MQAEIIPIRKFSPGGKCKAQYLVKCPRLEMDVLESKCAHCECLRIMEEKAIKCLYRELEKRKEKTPCI